ELVEEALNQVAEAVEIGAEGRHVDAARHRLDIGPGATLGQTRSQGVAVIGAVGKQNLARPDGCEHIGGAASVMGLPGAELQHGWVAVGSDHGMDLSRQPAPRAPHASGSNVVPRRGLRGVLEAPFLTLVPCWWTRIEELSTICRSPS